MHGVGLTIMISKKRGCRQMEKSERLALHVLRWLFVIREGRSIDQLTADRVPKAGA